MIDTTHSPLTSGDPHRVAPESHIQSHTNVIEEDKDALNTYASCRKCLGGFTGFFQTWFCCLCDCSPYRTVPEGNVGVVSEFGKYSRLYAPGLYYINPCTEGMVIVSKKERIMDIRKSVTMTKDNLNVVIDAVIYYEIVDTYKSQFKIGNMNMALMELAMTVLRDTFGTVTMQQALEERDRVGGILASEMNEVTCAWGVNVHRVLIQEIDLTEDLKIALSTAVTAKRNAEAKIIGAQADVRAARLMRTTADMLDTPAAMQIRYLESLKQLGNTGNPKVMFFPSNTSDVKGKVQYGGNNRGITNPTTIKVKTMV